MQTNRILCVEDDADTRDILKIMLGFADLKVALAPDVDTALRLMECERFSLYVLDGGPQGITGLSPCERIRAADARAPIVIFSGSARESDAEAGLLAGANVYIVKPDIGEVVPAVKRLLEEARANNFVIPSV
jgi:DNA-binding response OmpR family regulator